jgi:hypothetical protein
MKHLLIGLAALVIAPAVMASEPAPAKAGQEPTVKAAAAKTHASKKKRAPAGKQHLPSGDLRHCLELKTNAEIIKCSEGR